MDFSKSIIWKTPKTFGRALQCPEGAQGKGPERYPLVNGKGGSTSGTEKLLDTMAFPLLRL
jgi:hypothetical protein